MIAPSPVNAMQTRQLSDNVKLTQQTKMQAARQHQAGVRAENEIPQQAVAAVPPVDPSSPVPQQQMTHVAHIHPGVRLSQATELEKQAFLQAAALLPLLPWLGRMGLSAGRWLLPRLLPETGATAAAGIGRGLRIARLGARRGIRSLPGGRTGLRAGRSLMRWAENPWTIGAAAAPFGYSLLGGMGEDGAPPEANMLPGANMPPGGSPYGGSSVPDIYNVSPQARDLYQMIHSASDSSAEKDREAALKLWKVDKHVRSRFL